MPWIKDSKGRNRWIVDRTPTPAVNIQVQAKKLMGTKDGRVKRIPDNRPWTSRYLKKVVSWFANFELDLQPTPRFRELPAVTKEEKRRRIRRTKATAGAEANMLRLAPRVTGKRKTVFLYGFNYGL